MAFISKMIVLSGLLLACSAARAEPGQFKELVSSVNAACAAEVSVCGGLGKGLLKCIRTKKQEMKDAFKVSEQCRNALMSHKQAIQEAVAQRKNRN